MFSTIVGFVRGPQSEYGTLHKVAAGLDFALFTTLFVVGFLATFRTAIPSSGISTLSSAQGWYLSTIGAAGLILLATRNIRSSQPLALVAARRDV